MTHVATLIAGDRFGPEVARATRTIPDAAAGVPALNGRRGR